jgi:hypothetical protein
MPDIEKVRELQSKVMKDIAAGAIIPIMMIGDELGLFEKLYEVGPCSSSDFEKKQKWTIAICVSGY